MLAVIDLDIGETGRVQVREGDYMINNIELQKNTMQESLLHAVKPIKKINHSTFASLISILLFIHMLLISSIGIAADSGININSLKNQKGYSISDYEKSEWTYSSDVISFGDNEFVYMLLISFGRENALIYHPELRFFVLDQSSQYLKINKATLIIDNNIFEITLSDLEIDGITGAYTYLVSTDENIIKALAVGNMCNVILESEAKDIQVAFSEKDLTDIKNCAANMLRFDFINSIDTGTPDGNFFAMLDTSTITEHIFEEIEVGSLLEEKNDQQGSAIDETASRSGKWKEYNIEKLGITLSLPSNYEVYTRDMNDFELLLT